MICLMTLRFFSKYALYEIFIPIVVIKGVLLMGNDVFMVFEGKYLENYTL
jgi:hypothetical protein